jgi:hypothetical protein
MESILSFAFFIAHCVSRLPLIIRAAGLRLRDIRSVDPALWVTNSAPALLVSKAFISGLIHILFSFRF